MLDLNDLYYFSKVADFGSYTGAARSMGVQTSKLSRRISALEAELGVRLLNRSTRRLSLTDAGRTFHQHCQALLAAAQAAAEAMQRTRASPQGLVRISCPTGLLQGGLATVLARYLEAYPQVKLVVDATNRRVDVVDEGVDLAIRVRIPPFDDSELASRTFGLSEFVLVASPDLVARLGHPKSIEDLGRMPTISMASASERQVWRFQCDGKDSVEFAHSPRLATDDLFTLRVAAIAGVGVARLPARLVHGEIESGALVRLLPGLSAPSGLVHAVFPSRRGMVPAVRALLDYMAANLSMIESAP